MGETYQSTDNPSIQGGHVDGKDGAKDEKGGVKDDEPEFLASNARDDNFKQLDQSLEEDPVDLGLDSSSGARRHMFDPTGFSLGSILGSLLSGPLGEPRAKGPSQAIAPANELVEKVKTDGTTG